MEIDAPAPLLVITGPTASGKTTLAVEVALALGGEIVGADSMQVYRGLDIGTAKPTKEELRGVRHHLIDVADPDEPFDAARYMPMADEVIADIHRRGKQVIVAGGTGLYIRVLLHGLHEGPPPSPGVRKKLQKRAESEGWPALHKELSLCDPESARRLHPNDGVRIIRALEIFESSGIPMSEWQQRHGFEKWRYPVLLLGIRRKREELNTIIDRRVGEMMEDGFQGEVKRLLKAGYGPELKPMQALGYRHLTAFFSGELGLEEAVEAIKTDTRRFAKRQMTWLRRESGIAWIDPDMTEMIDLAKLFWQRTEHGAPLGPWRAGASEFEGSGIR